MSSRQFPTSFEAVRSSVIGFLRACDPHMLKLHDRQLIKAEIERLRGGTASLGTGLKNTGVKRAIDALGRVVVPKEIRNNLGWEPGVPVEYFLDAEAETIVIQRYKMEKCGICGSDYSLTPIKRNWICEDCISKLLEG